MGNSFKTVSAISLSHYILSHIPSNQLKLQKLVYYSEGWHLAYFERSLIPEDFEAWVHGPVVRSMWYHYKAKGTMYTQFYIPKEKNEIIKTQFLHFLNQEQIECIDNVIKEYGDKTAYHLEALSHSELPWREARNGSSQSERSEAVISKDTMKRYYQSLFQK